jgi:uncharacterized protein Yka (UPF0111/DUF47 family)
MSQTPEPDMSEGKSFGFDKPKTKIYLLSFRMDKRHNDTLQNLFTTLEIEPKKDNQTNRTIMLIEVMERVVKENQTLTLASKSLNEANKKIEKLEKQIEEMKKQFLKDLAPAAPGPIIKDTGEGNKIVKVRV